MPRPGPRPYECIRRAWHSDSHQPLRGGLIQEIFRVVNELHSTSTRRKKEWQEKLPIVVLRAEEILYSKANSESEYLDVESLRIRLQDAVNTMIRREGSDESGPYLPPCVEAALSLGCPPRKTPRGHRQGYSRLPPRRSSTSTSVNPGNNIAPAAGKGSARPANVGTTIQEAGSSSTFCPLAPQSLARQDQGHSPILISTASPYFNPVATPSSIVSVCYPSDANSFPMMSSTFPSAPEVSHTVFAPSFPEFGSSDFLRAADARRPPGFQVPGNLDPFSQMLSNFHQDPRAVPCGSQMLSNFHQEARAVQCVEPTKNSGARVDLGLFCFKPNGSLCTSSTVSSPISTISNMSQILSTESAPQQAGQMYSGISMPGMDSVRCKTAENSIHFYVDTQLHLPLQMHAAALDNDLTSVMLKSGSPSPCQQTSAGTVETACTLIKPPPQRNPLTPVSADTANTACSLGVHDLQLRLGPPQKEPTPSHAGIISEQLASKSWQLTEEGTSNASSWNDLENGLGCAGNNHAQVVTCKKFGLNADGCANMPVIAVDTPASKRVRSDNLKHDCSSPPCENMLQLGSGLAASMPFIWPRW